MVSRFEKHVRSQVSEFLQTVVMIDDEALRRLSPQESVREYTDEWEDDSVSLAGGASLKLAAPTEPRSGDDLDVQEVTVSFANRGLSCAILSPQSAEENENLKPAFVKTAKRADALILDWSLNGDDGRTAEKLVRAVLKQDRKLPHRRLRLIVIYTGEPALQAIADRIAKATDESARDGDCEWDDENKVAFSRGPVRVAVFSKEHVINLPVALESRRRSISALPTVVVEEFGRHSMGLVTSAALSALTGIRNDSHRLLAVLSPLLDPALLGQRVALNHPEDVERQVETLIGSELLAIVQDHEIGAHIGLSKIKDWLTHHKHLRPRGLSAVAAVTEETRLQFLTTGLGDDVMDAMAAATQLSKSNLRKVRADGTALFAATLKERDDSTRILAERMSMRSRYSKPTPILQLGSVVEQDGSYAVCVQPLCDSVRIKGSRVFPLVPLEIAAEGDLKSGDGLLTVRDSRQSNGFVRLRVLATPAGLQMVEFMASELGVVQARVMWGVNRFPTSSNKTWRWVGELKPDHAQRVVETLASKFSRIGLDESEILRLGL